MSEAHNHGYDPGCLEHKVAGGVLGDCLLMSMETLPQPGSPFEDHLENVLLEINDMMVGRHAKYGPGNIAEFGPLGILVRMSDKFSRLKNGQENHDDETVENTLDDVIGYALIWKLWLRKEWPGSE